MKTFKQFLESKKDKLNLALNIEGEPVVTDKKVKPKSKIKRVLDTGGEPETV
jgi:hypothetical protein